MIVDSSAILAVFLREPGFERFLDLMAESPALGIGAPTLAESGIVLTSRLGRDSRLSLGAFLHETGMDVIPFGDAHWKCAIEAYGRYGKGRHPAALNFGDCMTYATAALSRQPLLCRGDDFAQTDLALIATGE
ncbi:MAG: type II toxin-antitoxin system VapC family toxin [Thermoanaerobaculia bacterium]|nr:type II toxin-antitoxin system VapC family toxin [Thermoanaerobaculia bacterium]